MLDTTFTLQCLQLAPIAAGRIDTRIRRVNCSPPAGMAINVMDGRTGSGFLKFTVQVRLAFLKTTVIRTPTDITSLRSPSTAIVSQNSTGAHLRCSLRKLFYRSPKDVSSMGAVKSVEVAGAPPANARVAFAAAEADPWVKATPVIATPAGKVAEAQDAALANVLALQDPALPNNTDPVHYSSLHNNWCVLCW